MCSLMECVLLFMLPFFFLTHTSAHTYTLSSLSFSLCLPLPRSSLPSCFPPDLPPFLPLSASGQGDHRVFPDAVPAALRRGRHDDQRAVAGSHGRRPAVHRLHFPRHRLPRRLVAGPAGPGTSCRPQIQGREAQNPVTG